MKPQTKQVAATVGAVVAGVTAGYVAGVLTAPAKGSETRRRIREKVEAGKEELAHKAKVTANKAKVTMLEAKESVANAIPLGEEKVAHAVASLKRDARA